MFEVKKHLIKVDGNRMYLPVAARLVWFRQEHPDWGIETKPILLDTDKQVAVFEASVFNAEGKLMAKGTKMETAHGFPDYIEAAETGAIGRALAVCGFGTQFAPELDEVARGRIVDSPQIARGSGYQNGNGYTSANNRYQPRPANVDNSAATSSTDLQSEGPDTSRQLDVAATGSTTTVAEKESEHECVSCGRPLTKGQEALSVRKFGIALCPDCQKERKAAEAA